MKFTKKSKCKREIIQLLTYFNQPIFKGDYALASGIVSSIAPSSRASKESFLFKYEENENKVINFHFFQEKNEIFIYLL